MYKSVSHIFWHKGKLIVKTISTLIKAWIFKFYQN